MVKVEIHMGISSDKHIVSNGVYIDWFIKRIHRYFKNGILKTFVIFISNALFISLFELSLYPLDDVLLRSDCPRFDRK
jgi:hypothetical protein